ncbi:Cholecystokinin receptor [Holothuria leucospilota]|uniref:Cholecystokinin receptor n=1 Tax=Holothuria leucospilota TaxID=206669 RepID=A0A9Q1C8D3_HOLLE|nr:Cholecystokinin receptor [Holothuria leucospilota]
MKDERTDTMYCAVAWDSNSTAYKLYAAFNLIFLLISPTGMMILAYSSVIYALYKNKKATAGRKQSSPGRLSVTFQNGATKLQLHASDEPSSTSTLLSDVSPAREVRRDQNGNRCNAKNRCSPFRKAVSRVERDEDADKIKRIVVMLIVIVLLFVICWAPVLVLNFIIRFEIIHLDGHTEFILSTTSHLMAFSNSSVNPFAYALLSKNFRESTKQVFRQCCFRTEQRHLQHRPSISSTRFSRLSSSIPRWKGVRNDYVKEDPV